MNVFKMKYASFNNLNVNEEGYFEGIASSDAVDKHKDIVNIEGALYSLPLPALFEHQSNQVLGVITNAEKIENNGKQELKIKGYIDLKNEEGFVSLEKRKLIRELSKKGEYFFSIGFHELKTKKVNGINHIEKLEIKEISFVRDPANIEAKILKMKNEEISSNVVDELNEFYEKYDEMKKKQKKEEEEFVMNIINTTMSTKEFKTAVSNLKSINTSDVEFIMEQSNLFYKRCEDYYAKKEKSVNNNTEIKEKNKIIEKPIQDPVVSWLAGMKK